MAVCQLNMAFETLTELVEKVSRLPSSAQGSIFRVLINHDVPYTRNANGIFVLAHNLANDVIRDIEAHVLDAEQHQRRRPMLLQQLAMPMPPPPLQQSPVLPTAGQAACSKARTKPAASREERAVRTAAMARFTAAVSIAGSGSNASAATAAAVRRTSRFALARKRYARPCPGSAYGHPAALAHPSLTVEEEA
jgi:hypothetical protein